MKLIFLFFAAQAHCLTIVQPQTHAQKLRDKIAAINPAVTMSCTAGSCSVTWNAENQKGLDKIGAQTRAIKDSLVDELDALEAKIDNDTATPADVQRIAKVLLLLRRLGL